MTVSQLPVYIDNSNFFLHNPVLCPTQRSKFLIIFILYFPYLFLLHLNLWAKRQKDPDAQVRKRKWSLVGPFSPIEHAANNEKRRLTSHTLLSQKERPRTTGCGCELANRINGIIRASSAGFTIRFTNPVFPNLL